MQMSAKNHKNLQEKYHNKAVLGAMRHASVASVYLVLLAYITTIWGIGHLGIILASFWCRFWIIFSAFFFCCSVRYMLGPLKERFPSLLMFF